MGEGNEISWRCRGCCGRIGKVVWVALVGEIDLPEEVCSNVAVAFEDGVTHELYEAFVGAEERLATCVY